MDAIHAYEEINKKIDKEIFQLDDYSEIQYGIQCNIVYKAKTYLVRIYNSKKGTKLDLSQIKNQFVQNEIKKIFQTDDESFIEENISEKSNGRVLSLCIGINAFSDKYFSSLQFAEKDAEDLNQILIETFGFGDGTIKLTGSRGTLREITTSINEIKSIAKPEDTVVLFFATHGEFQKTREGVDFYLIGLDSEYQNLIGTALPMNTLKNLIKDIAAEKKLILLDTCHSGGICRRDGSDITPAMKEEVFQSFSSEDFVIITSCLENELSHEFSELEHGVFSYYLLSGLTGAVEVKDSFIDLYTLFIYVNRSVIDYVKEYKKRNQTPKFFGNLKGPFYLPKLSATAQPILDENISQFAKKPLDNESVKISFETINCIGIDESGKGDYFGPLVVAGVYVNTENKMEELRSIGIKDSKQLSDGRIIALARRIRKMCDNEVIAISPRRYNELYQDMANLNEILAWAHAQSMEQLLIRNSECDIAISDQFAWKDILINKLKQRGKNIHVIQRPKAEENVAVAAASILARAKFLDSLESLGKTNQASFSKGVADKVIEEAVFHLKRGGSLRDVAKMHFKTTSKVLKKYNK